MNRFSLTVQYAAKDADADSQPKRELFRAWVKAAIPPGSKGEVTLRLVSAEEGGHLNRQYRGKDYPTNVLSFPYGDPPEIVGDLAICPSVVEREAAEQQKPLESHYAHLTVHGLLHLQGYDHENAAEAEIMETYEREILSALGYPDPYDESCAAAPRT